MSLFKKQVVIIGGSKAAKEQLKAAYEVGKEIAKNRYLLVCGGKGGVMEAACRGAKENKGFTVGIIPESNPEENLDNKYLDIVIPTGINSSRNYIVQNSGPVIIMIAGGYGTLSELGFALARNKKVISLKSKWAKIDKKIIVAKNAKDAVLKAINQ